MNGAKISIVTPTLKRPDEIRAFLANVRLQSLQPFEIVIVDGLTGVRSETEDVVEEIKNDYPISINYIRHTGGTAIQRNVGIEAAQGDLIAFVDDDVRLDPDFLLNVMNAFSADTNRTVGGIVGYRKNRHFSPSNSERWRWYKRLNLLSVYEPGRYDFECGYPINSNMQPPFSGTRTVDFMTTACAVWRKEVFASGLRFHPFFRDYGVLEDAHLSLRAGKKWDLLQCGDALCEELNSPNGRSGRRQIGYKCVVNYYFVFRDVVGPLTAAHKFRFWRYQAFELLRITVSAVRRRNWGDVLDIQGRVQGAIRIFRGLEEDSKDAGIDGSRPSFGVTKEESL
ncbi:MAG: glycosyltransferase family 2 protein [Acidobacteriota bacterium]